MSKDLYRKEGRRNSGKLYYFTSHSLEADVFEWINPNAYLHLG